MSSITCTYTYFPSSLVTTCMYYLVPCGTQTATCMHACEATEIVFERAA